MRPSGIFRGLRLAGAAALAAAAWAACGGGGGNGGTRIEGNLVEAMALRLRPEPPPSAPWHLSFPRAAYAQVAAVEVCIVGTSACTTTAEDGTFRLRAEVSGDVTLSFSDGAGLDARLAVSGVPRDGSVELVNVRCSRSSQDCSADEVRIEGGGATLGPVRCESGSVTVRPASRQVVVDGGGGEDCLEARGNCTLTVRVSGGDLILRNCGRCIDAGDGSPAVGIEVRNGDLVCQANEEGIRSENESTVEVSVSEGSDLTVSSVGENGIRARDSSTVTLAATGTCTIRGATNATRRDSTATIDTSGCQTLVLEGEQRVD